MKNQQRKPTVVIRPKSRRDSVIASLITEGKSNSVIQCMFPDTTMEEINQLRRKPCPTL